MKNKLNKIHFKNSPISSKLCLGVQSCKIKEKSSFKGENKALIFTSNRDIIVAGIITRVDVFLHAAPEVK